MTQIQLGIGIVLLLISFFTGGFAGFKFNEAKVVKAEASLSQIKLSGEMAQKHYNREQELLKAQIKTIQEQGWEALANSAKNFEEYKAQQVKNLAKKDQEIANSKLVVSSRERELGQLRIDLASAVNEVDKAKIQAQISAEEKAIIEAKLRQKGLECLEVPIPEEYVSDLNTI